MEEKPPLSQSAVEQLLKAPSTICSEFSLQNCHFCDRMDCCDNVSSAAEQLLNLRNALAAWKEVAVQACKDVNCLEQQCNKFRCEIERLQKQCRDYAYNLDQARKREMRQKELSEDTEVSMQAALDH